MKIVSNNLEAKYMSDVSYGDVFIYIIEESVYYCMKVDLNGANTEDYNAISLHDGCLIGIENDEPIYVIDATLLVGRKEVKEMDNSAREMTVEELKMEADKLGYRLSKKQPYVPFPSCKCTNYRKGINRFRNGAGWYYRCGICGLASEPAKLVRDAELNWYNLTKEVYGREEVKRK